MTGRPSVHDCVDNALRNGEAVLSSRGGLSPTP